MKSKALEELSRLAQEGLIVIRFTAEHNNTNILEIALQEFNEDGTPKYISE